jgi:hypothetical protein
VSHHYSGPNLVFPRGDARLDFTDLYAVPKPGDPSRSILIMDVHPSVGVNPPGPTTAEPFAPEALYEIKIDTDDDAVADIAYQVCFTYSEAGGQTATVRRLERAQAAGTGEGRQVIVEGAPVSMTREAQVTEAGDYRIFAGWRSDPFFFDAGALNNFQFIGQDFFADKDICSIVLEVSNIDLGSKEVRLWARTVIRADGDGARWVQTDRGARASQTPSLLASRTKPTGPGSRRMMPVSSQSSRTRWSIRGDLHRRKRGAWHGRSCRISSATTPRARRPTRTMAANSPTMPPMPSWLSSRTGK